MTLSLADKDGRSTIAAAEAQSALASGDTARAREKYAEAGGYLERAVASATKQPERHLLRFLAANQYFLGGDYPKAFEISKQIESRPLPVEVRHLYPKFARDVRARAAAGYAGEVKRELQRSVDARDLDRVLELLREHPYALTPGAMAFVRAITCEELGNYRAAALFYADAIRLNPEGHNIVFAAAALPLKLPRQGKVSEALDYVRLQLEAFTHPVTHAVASLLSFHMASEATSAEEGERYLKAQAEYLGLARASFNDLPVRLRDNPKVRELMGLAFEAAALGLRRLGDDGRAVALCDEAIAFEPGLPNAWVVRGMVRYPAPGAVEDFRKAVELREAGYLPYYYLAHDALTKGDFRSALDLCRKALGARRGPGSRVQSQLLTWVAICQSYLGAKAEEVEGLFREALQVDPGSEENARNFDLFLKAKEARSAEPMAGWKPPLPRGVDAQFVSDREDQLFPPSRNAGLGQRELQLLGA